MTATIEGGDAFVRIEVLPGHDVVVSGYAGEPYLWIDGAGAVHENRHSPATYYNQSRDGIAELPDEADPSAAPDWVVVGDGGAWAWHDHRAHYMGGRPPRDMSPGDALPASIIPLTVDGTPVEITVITTLVASPSAWPAVIGGLAGLALVVLAGLPDRRLPLAAVVVVVGAAASAVGIVQYLSLPAETGPRAIWWIPPVVATACGIALVVLRSRSPFLRTALLLVAGSQLIVWSGMRRFGLVRGVLPTSAPYWLDRCGDRRRDGDRYRCVRRGDRRPGAVRPSRLDGTVDGVLELALTDRPEVTVDDVAVAVDHDRERHRARLKRRTGVVGTASGEGEHRQADARDDSIHACDSGGRRDRSRRPPITRAGRTGRI